MLMSNPPIGDRLAELLTLSVGWDGYRGVPAKAHTAGLADRIAKTMSHYGDPAAVPGADGSIQLEWHQNGYDIEIDIYTRKSVSADELEAVKMKSSKPMPVKMGKDLALPPLSIEEIIFEEERTNDARELDNLHSGKMVVVPADKAHAKAMILVAEFYLKGQQEKRDEQT